jgi:hypothetical protein
VAAAGRELYHGRWTLCNGEDWGKRRAEGVSNPRFGAREDGADLGLLNFAYDHVGAREYGAELATYDFLGPRPSGSAPGSYGADMNYFVANRAGAEPRGQTTK